MEILYLTDLHENPNTIKFIQDYLKKNNKGVVMIGGDVDSLSLTDKLVSIMNGTDRMAMVLGNHDYPVHMEDRGILHGTTTMIGDYKVGGLGGAIPCFGPFEVSESEYAILCKNMGPVDILISHEPPYHTACDILTGTIDNGYHIGSKAISNYIREKQPLLSLHGHIHESAGMSYIGKTLCLNAGTFKEGYYAKINIVGKKVVGELKFDKNLVPEKLPQFYTKERF